MVDIQITGQGRCYTVVGRHPVAAGGLACAIGHDIRAITL
jgi:hypothetical protein